jgi:signal transduction histidine kinase
LHFDTPNDGRFFGDINRIAQVCVNLVGNAIKFTPRGGNVHAVFSLADAALTVSVADTGMGIPPENMEFIFEAFRRLPDYATRTTQGAGLGLSISKKLIELMGGQIEAYSKAGEGSVFTFILPIFRRQYD